MRILLLLSALFLSGCSHMANDSWSGQDKAQHFLASAMLSAAGNEYAQHQGTVGIVVRQSADVLCKPWGFKRTVG